MVSFIGDIALGGILSMDPGNNANRFSEIVPILKTSDFVFANLETPVKIDDNVNQNKQFIHYALPDPSYDLLNLLNIGCVSLANNHIFDSNITGLRATIEILDEQNIYHTGAGWKDEHVNPVVINREGKNIGFMAYVDQSTNPKTENYKELFINYLQKDKIISDVKLIRSEVDTIICSLHWGKDYSFYPTQNQVELAHALIESGVDIIMGHHPHTIQPYEKYLDGTIFYSLGGLTFGDFIKDNKMYALYRKTKIGIIAHTDTSFDNYSFISTKEHVGNYVEIINRDYESWSKFKWRIFRIKEKYSILSSLINFKENVIDRVVEYFFGYYQSPLRRLFQLSNVRKLKRLFNNL